VKQRTVFYLPGSDPLQEFSCGAHELLPSFCFDALETPKPACVFFAGGFCLIWLRGQDLNL
jgi:hypothetical protein